MLSQNYQSKLLQKLQENFTNTSSFFCYLNYNKNDFVIDLDTVWKWLGFGRKNEAKRLLEKHFLIDRDYNIHKNTTVVPRENVLEGLGGERLLKEKILMNINTFKKLCLKSNTKKADEIHEEILQETITEESDELKLQLTDQQLNLIILIIH